MEWLKGSRTVRIGSFADVHDEIEGVTVGGVLVLQKSVVVAKRV